MMKRFILASLVVLVLLLSGCAQVSVKEINTDVDRYMGEKVVVSGKVLAPMQIGSLSGFTLKDDGSSIMVSSELVPKANSEVIVKGTIVKGLFTQHYLFADDVKVK